MSKGNRFTEKFKLEVVKQVVERGFGVADVSKRLGVSSHSLYAWITKYGLPAEQRLAQDDQAAKLNKLGLPVARFMVIVRFMMTYKILACLGASNASIA